MKTISDSIKELSRKSIEESTFDIDADYCLKHSIKFNNHEKDSSQANLFNSKSNKAVFNYVFSKLK